MTARLPNSPQPDRHVYPLRVNLALWKRFLNVCRNEDKTASRVIGRFIIAYTAEAEQRGGAR